MIRKLIIVTLMAFFGSELIHVWFFEQEPSVNLAVVSFITSIYLLFRLLFAIIVIEHYIQQHGNNDGKMG